MWTDNGKEFKGDFKKFLEENGIKQVLSKVKNPQQNGKCERFWGTAEKCKNIEELRNWIHVYNNTAHCGLPQKTVNDRKTHETPNQRYFYGVKWNLTISPTWKVDGVVKPFVPYGTD